MWTAPRPLSDGSPVVAKNGYKWEVDKAGDHCIVGPDGERGNWTSYECPAFSHDSKYICFSGYWDGYIQTEQLMYIVPVSDLFSGP